ncbi:hypothetical protein INR49_007685 [Caranx melampygus]|nr:hypothetical protein INR49_007685 [Caranx melampygus]
MEQSISQSPHFLCPIKEEDSVKWGMPKGLGTGSHYSCVTGTSCLPIRIEGCCVIRERARESSWERSEHVHISVAVTLNMMVVTRPSVFLLFHFYINPFDVIKTHQDCSVLFLFLFDAKLQT